MGETVGYEVKEGIAVLAIRNPPVNAVGADVRKGLAEGLRRGMADSQVAAIVILGAGRTFPAGSDMREFGERPADPWLPGLCNEIEACPKPVVAAIHGTALGGGFELALSAHYRIASERARIGFPEVTLGILPGAGGTQRAPRLAGAADALDLMLSGRPIGVTRKEAAPYIDQIVHGDLETEAIAFARGLLAQGKGPRPTRDCRKGFDDPAAYQRAITLRKEVVADRPDRAPGEIVKCVEAAELLSFDMGMAFERAAFEDCVRSDQAASLRHVFFAERRAAKFPELDGTQPRRVAQVGIVGGGTAGRGLVLACLEAEFDVVLIERNGPALRDSLGKINAYLDRQVAQGRLRGQLRDERMMRLHGKTDFVALSEADLVIEAVADDLREKEQVFYQLDAVVPEGAVLVTTTMRHDVSRIAKQTGDPGSVLGLGIGTPAHLQRVAEVIVPSEASADAVAALVGVLRQIRKIPVRVGGATAHIGRAMADACRHAAELMVEDGTTPYLVDEAMRAYGMAMGPFERLDRDGLREDWALRRTMAERGAPEGRQVAILDRLCEAGRFGKAAGKGYYIYDSESPHGRRDPEVIALIRAERESKGIQAQGISADEIQRRCLAAMVNEGARLLRLGVARCPSDIDVVMVHGYGFPRWRGGPMKAADLIGPRIIQRDIESFAAQDGVFWSPEPVFDSLFKAGQGFDALNA
ncbi:3-hydroxyacyl-CoA dehydrogenase NAD-binding domain-containing protein [Shimia aestuarii]|uniref:3-hydroxyacyl-CoA dehydrogenase NAD-binding domain-containing protein n=1 Tax=Shimia aestuarii TaxID=254406 RepID=UPI001FB349F8|nr:3-hydroxyacyl-CoA dehydrogenase NAD-binding domain-containing protein [Shimia aestuarii]